MFVKIAIVVVVIVAVVLLVAATRPNTIRIQRSVVIDTPAQKVFAMVNDFHNWPRWAPQDREDATMQRSFTGSANGAEAISDWQSRGSAGAGRMSITVSVPYSRVVVETDFRKPFVAHNVNEFVFEPVGIGTKVTWTMTGQNLFVMKVMCLFVNMDRVMGNHFESGLRNLKAASEAN
jgi:uncharacterized protein YndB with AHSA1/START domain